MRITMKMLELLLERFAKELELPMAKSFDDKGGLYIDSANGGHRVEQYALSGGSVNVLGIGYVSKSQLFRMIGIAERTVWFYKKNKGQQK